MILSINDVKLNFSRQHKEVLNLLNGVNLSVEEGAVTALIGGNGTGKTTLFNIISGIRKGYSGDVIFDGHSLNNLSPHIIARLGIGRLFQGGQLISGLSLMENFITASSDRTGEMPLSNILFSRKSTIAEKEKKAKAEMILRRFFGEQSSYIRKLGSEASAFSYGEQRILSLCRLLMGDYKLLLLDEPTSGVHPRYIKKIMGIIKELVQNDGLTVLLIEHNMHFIYDVADTCAYMEDGKIAVCGPCRDVLKDRKVRNSYLGL